MSIEFAEAKIGEVVFSQEEKRQFIHQENSKNGFDICFICHSDSECQNQYLGRNIISEEAAWQIVNDMVEKNPYFYSMMYVVYISDLNGHKSPVLGYRAKAFIR